MSPSRRAFAAAAVAALAGCAGVGRDRQGSPQSDDRGHIRRPPDPDETTDDAVAEDVPNPQSGAFQDPFDAWIPDLTVVNHHTDGMTAYVRLQTAPWAVPTFRETVSIRGHTPGREPVSSSLPRVEARSSRSVLVVRTADGRRGRHRYRGSAPERGVVVRVHEDRVAFERVGR